MKPWAIVIFLAFFIFHSSIANAGDVLFQTTLPWYYNWLNALWGKESFTNISNFSIRYTPATDQEVCTIKVGLYREGSPTDDVTMTVRGGGNGYPTAGSVIGTVVVHADQVAGPPLLAQASAYTSFPLSSCLELKAGTNYSFNLSRSQLDSSNLYVSQISNFIFYSETASWVYLPSDNAWLEKINFEPALRLEGPDKTGPEPVIIVPGILGSRLNRVSDGEEIWPNIGKMANLFTPKDEFLDDLKLNNNGNELLDINSGDIVDNVLGANQYGNLIKKFENNGYILGQNLFVVPYDWRLDIDNSSKELDPIIDKAVALSPSGKVNIIAHSMGGLVVKDYLMRKGESVLNKLIFAGTPHLGAPKAFNALNWGDDFDIKFLGMGLNKDKAKDITQNMPSVYELLPSKKYLNKAGSYVKDNLAELNYDETSQFMASSQTLSDHRNLTLLDRADEFHLSHDNWLPQSAKVYNLLGCREYDTIGSFSVDDDGSVDINSVTGDGTVPLKSAEHIPGKNYYVPYPQTKINHTGLISDDRTIDLLYGIVSSGSITLADGISESSNDCDNIINEVKRLRFSTHSPVNLHVYDNNGNHTGLSSDGSIENNIPDSNFIQVGDNTFIFVPEGRYSVKIDAYATGSFDFKVKELINGDVQSSFIFGDIPINDPALKAGLDFISIEDPPTLNIDDEGDGEADKGISPDGSIILYHVEPELPISSDGQSGTFYSSNSTASGGIVLGSYIINDMPNSASYISEPIVKEVDIKRKQPVKVKKVVKKLEPSLKVENITPPIQISEVTKVLATPFLNEPEKSYTNNNGHIKKIYDFIKKYTSIFRNKSIVINNV